MKEENLFKDNGDAVGRGRRRSVSLPRILAWVAVILIEMGIFGVWVLVV